MTRYQQSKCQACGWLGLSVAEVMEDNRLCASCSWQVLRPLPISQGDRRLGTTFPRLPCQLAFSQLPPRRLGGRRRREAIVLLVQAGQCGLQKCWLWFQQQEQGDPSNRIVGVCSVALGHSLLFLQSSKLVLSLSPSLPFSPPLFLSCTLSLLKHTSPIIHCIYLICVVSLDGCVLSSLIFKYLEQFLLFLTGLTEYRQWIWKDRLY